MKNNWDDYIVPFKEYSNFFRLGQKLQIQQLYPTIAHLPSEKVQDILTSWICIHISRC
jgi:hypothetical protein